MANSKFTINFLAIPTANDEIIIAEETLGLELKEIFKANRLALYQTKIPPSFYDSENDITVYAGRVSTNYASAFGLDYNSTGLFTVTFENGEPNTGLGSVTVEANYPGAVFTDFNTLPEIMEVTIVNEEATTPIEIDTVSFLEADTLPCQNVNVEVETSVLATVISSSIPITQPTQASSNMLLYSEDLSNSAWSKTKSSITGNKVVVDNTYGFHGVLQTIDKGSSSGEFTLSFYVKNSEFSIISIAIVSDSNPSVYVIIYFDTIAKTFSSPIINGGFSTSSYGFSDEEDGFMRVNLKANLTTVTSVIARVDVKDNSGNNQYTGDGISGFFLDKLQFQEGDLTPYLQTTDTALEVSDSDGTVIEDNTDNPFELTLLRGQTFTLTVENEDGNQASQIITVPSALDVANFSININNSPNGATVTVSNVNSDGLDLEYSLNGTDWQESNVFSGLEADSYTLHVRDQYGCSKTIDFAVTDSNIYVPYFYISKSNSIRYAQRITWGDAANYKTDENTLSCEVEVGIPYHEVQLFQTADVITTQFKSNYASNIAKVVRADASEVNVPVVQKTNYIGQKDKRDARKYNLGDGKVGIYFLAGNRYDYDTNAVTGTHALNGLLPEWGVVGNYINIASAWFLIEQVIFDESKNADVLVITETYTGVDSAIISGCIYNIKNYEVFEYSIDMADYQDESIRVKLTCTDDNFPTIEHLSEQIDVAVRHPFTLDINYWNPENNDVFYGTGIRHRIRPIYTKAEGVPDEDSSIHKTDTDVILLNADLFEGKKFIFEPVTEEIWRKLMMALSHKEVYINGVKYAKNGDFETEGPLEETNLYVLKATMLKRGNAYNSDGTVFGTGSGGAIEVPGLIEGNDGFISY